MVDAQCSMLNMYKYIHNIHNICNINNSTSTKRTFLPFATFTVIPGNYHFTKLCIWKTVGTYYICTCIRLASCTINELDALGAWSLLLLSLLLVAIKLFISRIRCSLLVEWKKKKNITTSIQFRLRYNGFGLGVQSTGHCFAHTFTHFLLWNIDVFIIRYLLVRKKSPIWRKGQNELFFKWNDRIVRATLLQMYLLYTQSLNKTKKK